MIKKSPTPSSTKSSAGATICRTVKWCHKSLIFLFFVFLSTVEKKITCLDILCRLLNVHLYIMYRAVSSLTSWSLHLHIFALFCDSWVFYTLLHELYSDLYLMEVIWTSLKKKCSLPIYKSIPIWLGSITVKIQLWIWIWHSASLQSSECVFVS